MTFLKKFFIVSLYVACLSPANAQTSSAPVANKDYCGSGFTEPLVPDEFWGCKMAQACKIHDVCYGKCDVGGSKHGTPYCEKSEFSVERTNAKSSCDMDFLSAISKQNNNQWKCNALAGIYATAVALGGQGPFNGKPMPKQALKDLIETSNSPDEARSKFSELAKLSQYKRVDLSGIQKEGTAIKVPALSQQSLGSTTPFVLPKGMKDEDVKNLLRR